MRTGRSSTDSKEGRRGDTQTTRRTDKEDAYRHGRGERIW